MNSQRKKQRGVGLLEALIAALVFAVGIGAAVKLQGTFFQSGSNANARATAVSMAQAKLDELRGTDFSAISGGTDNPTSSTGTAFTYARTWTSTNYYYDNVGVLTPCTGTCSADQKAITVTVSWNGPDPNNDKVALNYVINKNASEASSFLIGYTSGGSGEKPVRTHNPGLLPDVVPISIGNGQSKETSKPLPDVSQNDQFVETEFTVDTYKPGGGNELVREEEFLTLNCECRLNGAGSVSSGTAGRAPSRQVITNINGENRLTYVTGEKIDQKIVGSRISTGQSGQQAELCSTCCRDHHDSNGPNGTPLYDPFRPSSDYRDGDHKHYNLDNSGNLVFREDYETYLESCRMKRIDGTWRVMQDWRIEKLKVMPSSFLLTESGLTNYQNFVSQFVKEYVLSIPGNNSNAGTISTTTTFTNEPDNIALQAGVNNDGNINVRTMSARAIYIDFMDSTMVQTIKNQVVSGALPDAALQLIPFYDVNVTKLATWGSSNNTQALVTSQPVQNDNTHSRGVVTTLAAGTPNITATIEKSNTGLTDTVTIDPADRSESIADGITLVITGGSSPSTGTHLTGSLVVSGKGSSSTGKNPNDITVTVAIYSGATLISSTACNRLPNGSTVDGNFDCLLDVSADRTNKIIFGNISTMSKDNLVCPQSGGNPSASVVYANDGTTSESATYSFTYSTAPSSSPTLNVILKSESVGC